MTVKEEKEMLSMTKSETWMNSIFQSIFEKQDVNGRTEELSGNAGREGVPQEVS